MAYQNPPEPPPGYGRRPQPGPGPGYPYGPPQQPAPGGYGPQGPYSQVPKKWYQKPWVWIVIGVLIVIGIVASANSKKNNKKPAAATTGAATQPVTSLASAPSAAATTTSAAPKPKPKPVTVLSLRGNGIKNTQDFTVHTDQWRIVYTYDCSDFGQSGNFAVTLGGDDFDVPVNEIGKSGHGTSYEHSAGKFNLGINSECAWTIAVRTG